MPINHSDPALRDAVTRKAEFREEAKDILWKDRQYRKFGRSVDTGGSIARAMESAYKLGLAHGASMTSAPASQSTETPRALPSTTGVAWNSIPSRARSTFDSMLRFRWVVLYISNAEPWKPQPDRWACYRDNGEDAAGHIQFDLSQTFSPTTLAPLVRLGLMQEYVDEKSRQLLPTDLGIQTWMAAIESGQARPVTHLHDSLEN